VGGRFNVDDALARVRTGDPDALADALRSKSGIVIAAAAKRLQPADPLIAELAPAFVRLCEDPIKRDPGCRGKIAIARALHDLVQWEDDVFACGVTLVQSEPAFGPPVDTAAELRGVCGMAYAHFVRADALDVLARLLADAEHRTRAAAAQALGDSGRPDASALLRYKLLIGDADGEVLGTCAESLLALQRDAAVGFLTGLLGGDDRGEAIVLAFGSARCTEARDAIVAWCEQVTAGPRGRVGYLALALLRTDAANAYLLDKIRSGGTTDALAAAKALATFKDDAAVRAQILAAAADRAPRERAEIAELV